MQINTRPWTGNNSEPRQPPNNHRHFDDIPAIPPIYTYHCPCKKVIACTTYWLEDLSRRADPALDMTICLPLNPEASKDLNHAIHQTVLTNLIMDPHPINFKREDGYEKRTLYKCINCLAPIGYTLSEEQKEAAIKAHLDPNMRIVTRILAHLSTFTPNVPTDEELSNKTEEEMKELQDHMVIYIFPAWLVTTECLQRLDLEAQVKDVAALGKGGNALPGRAIQCDDGLGLEEIYSQLVSGMRRE